MTTPAESQVLRRFRERLDRGAIANDVKITYRVSGGMPRERVEEEVELSGDGAVRLMTRDVRRAVPAQEVSTSLDDAVAADLLKRLGGTLDNLVSRSEARFLPDSLVGTVTVEVGGDAATLYFQADEAELLPSDRPLSPGANGARQLRQHLGGISERLLQKKRGGMS